MFIMSYDDFLNLEDLKNLDENVLIGISRTELK